MIPTYMGPDAWVSCRLASGPSDAATVPRRSRRCHGTLRSMPEPLPTIRPFRAGDGESLRALWTSVGFRLIADDDAGLARFETRNPGLLLVADEPERGIVGSAMGAWDGRRGWLYHVAVAPDHRRRGLATSLVRRVEAGLREVGCERALAVVERGNDDALRFWEQLGYEHRDTQHLGRSL